MVKSPSKILLLALSLLPLFLFPLLFIINPPLGVIEVFALPSIVETYSPVIWQNTAASNYRGDFITSFNYDGNWIAADNWNHLDDHSLKARVYYSLVETGSHYFIGYYFFHPQDWNAGTEDPVPLSGLTTHENDFEGALVVVKKPSTMIGVVTRQHMDIDGKIVTDVNFEGSKPVLFVDAGGHGVYQAKWDRDWLTNGFPNGDGVVYRYTGVAEEPSGATDNDVGYSLISLDELWSRRFDQDMFAVFGVFKGNDGNTPNGAEAPWYWDQEFDGKTYNGEFLFDPADLVEIGEGWTISDHRYTSNTYCIEVVLEAYYVDWDEDIGFWDDSDGYLNLFLLDGEGTWRQVLGAPFYGHGSQNNWNADNQHDYWIDLTSEMGRYYFYGIDYQNCYTNPLNGYIFGIDSKDLDKLASDAWLMVTEATHWYTTNSASQSSWSWILDWTGSLLQMTVSIGIPAPIYEPIPEFIAGSLIAFTSGLLAVVLTRAKGLIPLFRRNFQKSR
ncbi:MAG: hypothetical protein ACXAEU_00775 [Candidatus Hodarchaeales archaeon]